MLQVLQGHVGDEEAVVQFQNLQPLLATGAIAQVQDSIICDELTMGQALQQGEDNIFATPSFQCYGLGKAGSKRLGLLALRLLQLGSGFSHFPEYKSKSELPGMVWFNPKLTSMYNLQLHLNNFL